MEYPQKEVDFYRYCPLCIYKDLPESEDPCDTCLGSPVNEHSRKPVMFKENKTEGKK